MPKIVKIGTHLLKMQKKVYKGPHSVHGLDVVALLYLRCVAFIDRQIRMF